MPLENIVCADEAIVDLFVNTQIIWESSSSVKQNFDIFITNNTH